MLRKFIMLAPALAFALPFVAAQPTMARPLANPVEASLWGDKHDDDDDDDDKGGDLELTVCFETVIAIDLSDREYECGYETGPACVSRCTAAAVAPMCSNELGFAARSNNCVEDQIAACERQCESGGAAFCAPAELTARHKKDDDDDDDDFQFSKHDDDDDDDKGGDDIIFINVETCIELNLGDLDR